MTFNTLLEEALESWEDVRAGVIAELENIPAEEFDFKPTDHVRTVREQAIHVLEVAMMMCGELCREDTDFKRAPWPDLLKMYAGNLYEAQTKNQLISLLQSQLEDALAKFRAAGELHMLQLVERFDGREGTRLAWLQHGIAQEMYHRGQLTLYARLLAIEPALTQKIKGPTQR